MSKKSKKIKEPEFLYSQINNKVLNYKVYVMNGREKIQYFLLTFVVGGIVGLIFYGGLFKNNGNATIATYISDLLVFIIVGLISRKIFIPIILEKLKRKRMTKLKLQFRDFLMALSNSISGGMNINIALKNAYRDITIQYSRDAYMVIELKEMLMGMENNVSFEDMMEDLGKRSGDDDIFNFATVFRICYRAGGNLKEVMKRTADIIGTKVSISEEIETTITSNKTQLMIMEVMPIVLVILMRFMSADFAESFSSIIGVVSITIGIGFFVASYKIGQKIMNIKG